MDRYRSAQSVNERENALAKDKTAKARQRSAKSADERQEVLSQKRTVMAKNRNSHQAVERECAKIVARNKMAVFRLKQTEIERDTALAQHRSDMAKNRSKKTTEETDFEKIMTRHKMRKRRDNQSGKDHLVGNLKAKKGMKLAKEAGWLREFAKRYRGGRNESREWELFKKKGPANSNILEKNKPEVAMQLNEKDRMEREKEE